MTLFYSMNVDFAWGATAGGGTAANLPLMGVGSWLFWIAWSLK